MKDLYKYLTFRNGSSLSKHWSKIESFKISFKKEQNRGVRLVVRLNISEQKKKKKKSKAECISYKWYSPVFVQI